jgi:hypothetical protein
MKIRNPHAFKEENYEPFKLPAITSFRGDKTLCPWDRLQSWLVDGYGVKKATYIYRRMYLREEEFTKFEKLMREWIKKYHPGISKNGLDMMLSIYTMTYSPYTFGQNPKWSKKRHAYLKKGKNHERVIEKLY